MSMGGGLTLLGDATLAEKGIDEQLNRKYGQVFEPELTGAKQVIEEYASGVHAATRSALKKGGSSVEVFVNQPDRLRKAYTVFDQSEARKEEAVQLNEQHGIRSKSLWATALVLGGFIASQSANVGLKEKQNK